MKTQKYHIQRICYFGDYDPEYGRTKVLIEGLRKNGIEVIECHEDSHTTAREKCIHLWREYRKIGEHDVVIVGFSNTRWMPLFARLVTRNPLIWDLQFSFYENWVFDRKLVREGSIKAVYHWVSEWLLVRVVDRIIMHTNACADYIVRTFGVDKRKFSRVLVGADTAIFYPRSRVEDGIFRVEYHGKYIPIHGMDAVIRAAKLLEDDSAIQFVLIGNGQERRRIQALAKELNVKNVEWVGFLPSEELPVYIAAAHLCVGLLGDVSRVEDPVPNKLYEAAAMGRVSINADTKGIRELFRDDVDVILAKRGDAQDIAKKIRYLKEHPEQLRTLEKNVLETFNRIASEKEIGRQLIVAIGETLSRS